MERMDLLPIAVLCIKIAVRVFAFSLGLSIQLREKFYFFKRPKKILISLFSILVVMPVISVLMCNIFNLDAMTKAVIIAASVAPIPASLPRRQIATGGESNYAITLMFAAILVSIFSVPTTIAIIGHYFDHSIKIPPLKVLENLGWSILLPALIGWIVAKLYKSFGEKYKRPLDTFALHLLEFGNLGLLIVAWPNFVNILNDYTLLVIVLFCLIGVVTGHVLGGPEKEDRTVLAFSTFSRHSGVAFAISSLLFPADLNSKATVVLYLLVSSLTSRAYGAWIKRSTNPLTVH